MALVPWSHPSNRTVFRITLIIRSLALCISCAAFAVPAFAQEQTFSDVPKDHFAYDAVQFLKANKIIEGYPDGTFHPDQLVTRAEGLKILLAPLVKPEQLAQAKAAKSSFPDVADDAWFKPYVELGRASGIIDGPPLKEKFNGTQNVLKAEFMKMVQQAFGADPKTAFSEIRLPLSKDVTDPGQWYYPYVRYGITSSMIMISADGTLTPGKQLTRAETALLLYRYIMYTQNRRTQALLSEAENEILIILQLLDKKDIGEAEYASARALLAARGANMSKPDEAIVKGAVKVTEAFRSLVRAYRTGINKDYDQTIQLAGDAWNLGGRAKELSPDLAKISDQVQTIAKSMADAARTQKSAAAQGTSAAPK